ncbi:MAG TPA: STAS domain-containing protein [Actinophytocola sp.]|jgi:anti-sigma B factor antagonist|uniref:STAS domain-containing protein n=1 Tax=Actinophytocola sp. TaxID=1872138 RepID=UPI002E098E7B|nr:STAS domain-containing protein [Actinophytocola sp.]
MNLLLSVRRDGLETMVSVAGEIDLGSSRRLHNCAREVIRRHGPRLAVDLAGVTFMDCGGVRVLLAIRAQARRLGGYLSVVSASGPVRKVVEILGMDRVLAVPERSDDTGIARGLDDGCVSCLIEWTRPGLPHHDVEDVDNQMVSC